ncbi:MAG: DUF1622 domain-containing protein [Tissierella sp.]|uniref:DUF1622 domain-containing protein n=1 Tax=Tissierella sp. TaxID=41274 RepID=UPI003F9DC35D
MIIHEILEMIIPYITGTLELIGVLIIVIAGVRAVKNFLFNRFNFKDDRIGVNFAQALSLSLEFKLGAEIIKTVVIRDLDEFIILAAVALLRVILTIVLHWELKHGTKDICNDAEATTKAS